MSEVESTQGWMHIEGGVRLYGRRWPVKNPKAQVVIIHGYADHAARYEHVARFLRAEKIASFTADLRGHGHSDGARGYINDFDEYLQDVDAILEVLKREQISVPLFIVGHSMGGLVALLYALRRKPDLRGLVVSSPFLGVAMKVPPLKVALGRLMSRIYPKLALASGINPYDLSHDRAVGDAYAADPAVFKTVTARWYTEAMAAADEVKSHAAEIELPTLILQAGQDRLADPKAAKPLCEKLGASDKTYIEYPDFYHEIFNESEKERPLSDMRDWILKRAS